MSPTASDGKLIEYKCIGSKVMFVAKEMWAPGEWSCRVGAVPGDKHDQEYQDIVDYGESIPEEMAKYLFPDWARNYGRYSY